MTYDVILLVIDVRCVGICCLCVGCDVCVYTAEVVHDTCVGGVHCAGVVFFVVVCLFGAIVVVSMVFVVFVDVCGVIVDIVLMLCVVMLYVLFFCVNIDDYVIGLM